MFRNCRAEGNIRMFLGTVNSFYMMLAIFKHCFAKMAMSKYQLAGSLEKKTLTLQEKIKFLDYAETNGKLGCQKLAVFKTGKTAANNILKNKQMLREQYEHFQDKTKKRSRPRKYKVINDILYYEWYQKCCSSNFYPNGALLFSIKCNFIYFLQNM